MSHREYRKNHKNLAHQVSHGSPGSALAHVKFDGHTVLTADDVVTMVEWATECADANRAAALLDVIKDMGGLQMLRDLAAQQGTRP